MKTRDKLILSILAWESGEAEVRLKSLELLRGLFGQRR